MTAPASERPLTRPGLPAKLATQTAKASYGRREAEGLVAAAALASRVSLERIGEGLKPLTTSQTPSENSHAAIGSAASPDTEDVCPHRLNNTPMSEATSRAAPMNPSRGRTRGTRRDWYSREPSNR